MNRKLRRQFEGVMKYVLLACAGISVLSVLFITLFIFISGVPLFIPHNGGPAATGLGKFLFGSDWYPTDTPPLYGILPFIVSSIMVTAGALILAVPIGLAGGIFIAEISKGRAQNVLRGVTEILAGIPSVVYGFFGVMMIGFFLRTFHDPLVNYNAFSAMVILAIMILPNIINMTEVSLRAVPLDYAEGCYALGGTHWQTIVKVLIPTARGGIFTGIILGMGRAIGETMAVLMVAGNQPTLPAEGLKSRVRTLTMAIVNDMGYAAGDHRIALFSTAIVLFVFILALNIFAQTIMYHAKKRLERSSG